MAKPMAALGDLQRESEFRRKLWPLIEQGVRSRSTMERLAAELGVSVATLYRKRRGLEESGGLASAIEPKRPGVKPKSRFLRPDLEEIIGLVIEKDKEFCDILDITDDGVVRIINCKPLKGSSALNYLFAQTQLYCEAFLSDATFLNDIRAHIQASGSPRTSAYLDAISADPREVRGQDYRVCLWLLFDEKLKTTPTRTELPLIAQFGLKLMYDRLRTVCKFQQIVLRFVPVKMVNFKSTKPLKRAAPTTS